MSTPLRILLVIIAVAGAYRELLHAYFLWRLLQIRRRHSGEN